MMTVRDQEETFALLTVGTSRELMGTVIDEGVWERQSRALFANWSLKSGVWSRYDGLADSVFLSGVSLRFLFGELFPSFCFLFFLFFLFLLFLFPFFSFLFVSFLFLFYLFFFSFLFFSFFSRTNRYYR